MKINIYVGNLSYKATDGTIREAFESFGEVTSARVIKDSSTFHRMTDSSFFLPMPSRYV